MHYKTKIWSTIALFFIFSVSYGQSREAWNSANRKELFDYIFNDIKSLSLTQQTKILFAKVAATKAEKAMPNGFQNVGSTRLREILLSTGKETFNELNDVKRGYWIIAQEDAIYKAMTKLVEQSMNGNNNAEIVDCTITQIMKNYPEGLKKGTEEERFKFLYKIGYECSQKTEINLLKWSKLTEDVMRLKIMEYLKETALNAKQKSDLTSCVISTMKLKYPEGLKGNLEKDFEQVTIKCIEGI
jgi:hypothetical protein